MRLQTEVMALYSLHHSSVGRTTHKAGTASAHIRYISRYSANPIIMAEHMPSKPKWALAWLEEQEQNSRKNARVIDKIMVALPIELDASQRKELIRSFVQSLTKGQAPWYAAIHQSGKDQSNPHCHIIIRDKSILNGRRVALLSEKGSTARIREQWAQQASLALKKAGYNITLDHRSYKDQGIAKIPGNHRGPKWRRKRKDFSRRAERPYQYKNPCLELHL